MAFRIRPRESIAHGLRRLARKELASAREQLLRARQPGDEAIHEARKSVKKARAIVHLIETDDGRGLGGGKKRLRATNRALSQMRDADVMILTLQKLLDRWPRLLSEHTLARVRHQLSDHKNTVAQAAARPGSWTEASEELRRGRAAIKRSSPVHRRFGALAPGLRVTHKRGRKAMARALERQGDADFHEWRKQIKALWYDLRLIEASGARIRREVEALNRAQTSLGDDHDAVVLCAYLSGSQAFRDGSFEFQRLTQQAERYQQELRRDAIASTKSIYATPTGAYVREVKRAWKNWDRRNRAGRSADQSRSRA
jgi:CHAD domain-containing protein